MTISISSCCLFGFCVRLRQKEFNDIKQYCVEVDFIEPADALDKAEHLKFELFPETQGHFKKEEVVLDEDGNAKIDKRCLVKVTNVNYKTQSGRMLLTQLNLTLN